MKRPKPKPITTELPPLHVGCDHRLVNSTFGVPVCTRCWGYDQRTEEGQ